MAQKKTVETKTPTTKVTFIVKTPYEVEEVYLCGSSDNLGAWNAKKALKLEYNAEKNEYSVSKLFKVGETVEFKALKAKDWSSVEKDNYNNEVQNRSFTASKGLTVLVEVSKFN